MSIRRIIIYIPNISDLLLTRLNKKTHHSWRPYSKKYRRYRDILDNILKYHNTHIFFRNLHRDNLGSELSGSWSTKMAGGHLEPEGADWVGQY